MYKQILEDYFRNDFRKGREIDIKFYVTSTYIIIYTSNFYADYNNLVFNISDRNIYSDVSPINGRILRYNKIWHCNNQWLKYMNTQLYNLANNLTKDEQDFLYQQGFTKISDSAFCNNDLITISKQDSIYIARVITINDTNKISSATEIKSKEKQNLEDFTNEVINSLYL